MASRPIIYVRTRVNAERVTPRATEVCISLKDPLGVPAVLEGWHATLRLDFQDVAAPAGHYREMTLEQARDVLAFARVHRDRPILVHGESCESRATAVALFLASWLNRPLDGDDELANQWVVQKLAAAGRRCAVRWVDARLAAVSICGPRGWLSPMPRAMTRVSRDDVDATSIATVGPEVGAGAGVGDKLGNRIKAESTALQSVAAPAVRQHGEAVLSELAERLEAESA